MPKTKPIPVPAPLSAGSTCRVWLNQAWRDVAILAPRVGYSLGIYTMPNGRAFLSRISYALRDACYERVKDPEVVRERLTHAPGSARERQEFARELLDAEVDAALDIEYATTTRSAERRARQRREEAEARLQAFDDAHPDVAAPSTAAAVTPPG